MAKTKYAVEYTDRLQRTVDTVLSNPNFSSYVPSRRPGRNTFTGRSTPVASSGGYEYSGEFAVRVKDGDFEVINGFADDYLNSPAGRILVGGKVVGSTAYYKNSFSPNDYKNGLFVYHIVSFEFWDGNPENLNSSISFFDSMEREGGEYDVYTLLAVIKGNKVFQAHFGPIYITDRYFDNSEIEGV